MTEPFDLFWVNMGDWPNWLKVKRIIEIYEENSGGKVLYVGSLTIERSSHFEPTRQHSEQKIWSEHPVEVFWQEKLIDPSHSHYFGVFRSPETGGAMITGAGSVADGFWYGALEPKTGEVIFSRYRHDYRCTRDGNITVDGGRDYFKSKGVTHPVEIRFVDGLPQVTVRKRPDWCD